LAALSSQNKSVCIREKLRVDTDILFSYYLKVQYSNKKLTSCLVLV
jgi:hypothetical protein